VLALTGVDYDASTRRLSFAPHAAAFREGELRCLFTTGTGWGELVAHAAGVALNLLGGRLDLDEAGFEHPEAGSYRAEDVHLRAGESVGLHPLATD
jgi:hypothetical protein